MYLQSSSEIVDKFVHVVWFFPDFTPATTSSKQPTRTCVRAIQKSDRGAACLDLFPFRSFDVCIQLFLQDDVYTVNYFFIFENKKNLLNIINLLKVIQQKTHFSDKSDTLGKNLSSLIDADIKYTAKNDDEKRSSSPSYDTDAQLYYL